MKEVKVIFNTIEECMKYLQAVENAPFELDLTWGSCVRDGKSLLGVIGFGLRKMLKLRLHTDDPEEAESLLSRLAFCAYPEMALVI